MRKVIFESFPLNEHLANNPHLYFSGGGNLTEITDEGDLHLYMFYKNVYPEEKKMFKESSPSLYYFESRGKSSLITNLCGICESSINPSYYEDDRFERLLEKPELTLFCTLIDIASREVIGDRTFTLNARHSNIIKKGLIQNSSYSRAEYEAWIAQVLYSRPAKQNIKLSQSLGKLYDSENIELHTDVA